MENQLLKKTFAIDDFDSWWIKVDKKFWFKAHDIAVFLDYKNPDDDVRRLVPSEAQKSWEELEPRLRDEVPIPPNWKPHTVLISDGGLYSLLIHTLRRIS